MPLLRRVGLPIWAAILAGACRDVRESPGAIGAPAPDVATVALGGDSVRLADHRGEVVLLNIWATWCHPCREELPELQRLHESLRDEGLRVVGLSVDAGGLSDAGRIAAFAEEFGVTYPIWLDPGEQIANTFRAIGVPTTVLIARDGRVLWRHTGPLRPGDETLARVLRTALDEPRPAAGADRLPVARRRGRHYIVACDSGPVMGSSVTSG